MPLYNTEIVYRAVIQADDAEAALVATKRERRDIEGDCAEPRYELVGPYRTPADFEDGWTETDYPYCGLGSAYIGQILLAEDGQPERDTPYHRHVRGCASMSENTRIEWADHSWKPWQGCPKVGPGCDNCYAEYSGSRTTRPASAPTTCVCWRRTRHVTSA
ncbi:hypothetical protein D9M68_189060 [compost metagenome]|nr:hypothetical protein CTP10_R75320 [Cupriavidus sp. P-10]